MQWSAWLLSRGGDYYKDKVRQGYDQDLSEGAGAKGTQQHLYNTHSLARDCNTCKLVFLRLPGHSA